MTLLQSLNIQPLKLAISLTLLLPFFIAVWVLMYKFIENAINSLDIDNVCHCEVCGKQAKNLK